MPEAPPPEAHLLSPNGALPNNRRLPLLAYRGVLELTGDAAGACERLFARHGWRGAWRNGIFGYDHFHTTMHEVLGIVRGRAKVRFGGDGALETEVAAGDVVVIPAGVAHRNLDASGDLLVIGAYPGGGSPDLCTEGGPEDFARAADVPVPEQDPVYGRGGPLVARWSKETS